jgi:hypothetical protein
MIVSLCISWQAERVFSMKQVRVWGLGALWMLLLALVPAVAAQGGNLLNNPGFEGFYRSYNYGSTIDQLVLEFRVADGLVPWFRPQAAGDPAGAIAVRNIARPGYIPTTGARPSSFFTTFGTHQAGLCSG